MTMQPIKDRYDVVIVGARCAGGATAMLLAASGLKVLAVDKSPLGADTLSTHALMRPAVLLLHRWGLVERLRREGTPPIRKTSFIY
ncbi:MAG TPA: FAD-dependent monooxygenase, partial [Polyangiales bacterium]|nr:FAD-dependent monooxygenase [Polyangiales bacterium]